jgi:hypothetical protein
VCPDKRFATIFALLGQPMVVPAAMLRELAQIRNAGNNLTLKAVVLQSNLCEAGRSAFGATKTSA